MRSIIATCSSLGWKASVDAEWIARYIDRVVAMSEWKDLVKVCVADGLCETLYGQGGAPTVDGIARAMRACGLERVYDAVDVFRTWFGVAQAETVAAAYGDFVVDEARVRIDGLDATYEVGRGELLGAAWAAFVSGGGAGIVGGGQQSFSEIRVMAAFSMTDNGVIEPKLPTDFDVVIPIAGDRAGLLRMPDMEAIWAQCTSRDMASAFARILGDVCELDGGRVAELAIGPEFCRTVRECGFFHVPQRARKLVRRMRDIVCGDNEKKGHDLREGPGPNEPTRMRGTWKGWRYDLDNEYHLHAWRSQSGVPERIELANIGVHGDFWIAP